MSWFRRVLSVLFIVLVASGAISCPALRHTHSLADADGASSHHHHHSHAGHEHHHHHHGDGHQHSTDDTPPLVPAVEHRHVVWFGFVLTIPAQEGSSHQPAPGTSEWSWLVGEMSPPETGLVTTVGDPLPRAVAAIALVSSLETATVRDRYEPSQAPPLPYCALRERSGVLRS